MAKDIKNGNYNEQILLGANFYNDNDIYLLNYNF